MVFYLPALCFLAAYLLTLLQLITSNSKMISFSILSVLPCFFSRSVSISPSFSEPLAPDVSLFLHSCWNFPASWAQFWLQSLFHPSLQLSNGLIQFQTPPFMGSKSTPHCLFPECSLPAFPNTRCCCDQTVLFSRIPPAFRKTCSVLRAIHQIPRTHGRDFWAQASLLSFIVIWVNGFVDLIAGCFTPKLSSMWNAP